MPTHEAFLGALPFGLKGPSLPIPRRRNHPAQGSSINDRFSRLFRHHRAPRPANGADARDARADRGCISEFETHYVQQRSTELLLQDDCALARLLCRLDVSGDRAATMASHLVSFLRGNPQTADGVEGFVVAAFDVHVARYSAATPNPRNVLRDNNLAALLVVCYLQQTCRSYLVSILQPVMTAIAPFVESCELDPRRLPAGHGVGTTSRNSYNLYCVCRSVLDAVFSAGRHAPAEMRRLCALIRMRIEAAWDLPELRPGTPCAPAPPSRATSAARLPAHHHNHHRPAARKRPRPLAAPLLSRSSSSAAPTPASAADRAADQAQQPMLELHDWENDLKSTVQVDIMNDIKTALDSWLDKPEPPAAAAAADAAPGIPGPPGPSPRQQQDDAHANETRQSLVHMMSATLDSPTALDMSLSLRGDKRPPRPEGLRLSQIKDSWRQTQGSRKPASPTGTERQSSKRLSGSYFTPTETVISMLIFVRFFIPILTSPEAYGLVEAQVSPDSRRGLLLCAKVLAVLCNGVSFGSKETYLMPMNGIIREYRPKLRRFLYAISSGADDCSDQDDNDNDDDDNNNDDNNDDHVSDGDSSDNDGDGGSDSVTLDELASQFKVVSVGAKIGTKEEQRKSRMSLGAAVHAAGTRAAMSADEAPPPVPTLPLPGPRHARQASKQSIRLRNEAATPSRKTFDLSACQPSPLSPESPVLVSAGSIGSGSIGSNSRSSPVPDAEPVDESLVTVDFLSCLESNYAKLEALVSDKPPPADIARDELRRLQAACHELKPIVHYAKHMATANNAGAPAAVAAAAGRLSEVGRLSEAGSVASLDRARRKPLPAMQRGLSEEYEDLGRHHRSGPGRK
ncbi:hypothetical protein H4R18_005657 [Coemansia javaensis]|uniref:Ras-GAP domain-containing protein n=1 Tax=Coemansia javaensis TaxID=2761396 RepID=A0A9W8H0X1_9FUNG|nr:hypothetical protein H4R18_005657 [Coemansia javaensis]